MPVRRRKHGQWQLFTVSEADFSEDFETGLKDAVIIDPTVHGDERGYFEGSAASDP